jgi:hypothetical protein
MKKIASIDAYTLLHKHYEKYFFDHCRPRLLNLHQNNRYLFLKASYEILVYDLNLHTKNCYNNLQL